MELLNAKFREHDSVLRNYVNNPVNIDHFKTKLGEIYKEVNTSTYSLDTRAIVEDLEKFISENSSPADTLHDFLLLCLYSKLLLSSLIRGGSDPFKDSSVRFSVLMLYMDRIYYQLLSKQENIKSIESSVKEKYYKLQVEPDLKLGGRKRKSKKKKFKKSTKYKKSRKAKKHKSRRIRRSRRGTKR